MSFAITHPESGQAFSSLGVGGRDLLGASLLQGDTESSSTLKWGFTLSPGVTSQHTWSGDQRLYLAWDLADALSRSS